MKTAERPVLIEAAIAPFRADAPVTAQSDLIQEAKTCLEAGAAIVHYHHDTRLERDQAIASLIAIGKAVLGAYPDALLYPGILAGTKGAEHAAHLIPMAEAGVLGFAPVDPGAAVPYDLDDDGLPIGHGYVWNSFATARKIAASMMERAVPLTIGVYEPVQLRWALAYEAAGCLPAGSTVKLYFGGRASLFNIGKPGLNFGLPPTAQALDVYLDMMAGSSLPWIVGLMGDALLESPLARYALERGGHLRVGIEDLGAVDGVTNRQTVEAAMALAAEVGRPVAATRELVNEARSLLSV